MLNSFIQVGKKLREDKTAIEYLPFVEKVKPAAKGKKEKPDVILYDVFINDDRWEFKKSDDVYDENVELVFVKGNKDDRFFMIGDINIEYLHKKKLKDYLSKFDKFITKENSGLLDSFIIDFRNNLKKNTDEIDSCIEKYVNQNKQLYIQFRLFDQKKQSFWLSKYSTLNSISNLLIKEKYLEKRQNNWNLKKQIVNYNISDLAMNALQNLDVNNHYKTIFFSGPDDQNLGDIIVANKYLKGKLNKFGNTWIQVIPSGEYTRESITSFLNKKIIDRDSNEFKEENLSIGESPDNPFNIFLNTKYNIYKYDVIFVKKSKSANTPDVVTEYITSINKSQIEKIKNKLVEKHKKLLKYVESIDLTLSDEQIECLKQNLDKLSNGRYYKTFEKIIFDKSEERNILKKHERIVLSKILREIYTTDLVLLPNLIKTVEFNLRKNNKKDYVLNFWDLFFNYVYLNFILKVNQFLMMQNTQSYQAGLLLGKLARNLDNEIASFSKQYAGNISRRIATKEDFQKLLNYISEKLVMHEKLYPSVRTECTELNKLLEDFSEKYIKDYAVAGFFYSYMMPFQKKKTETESES